jgi:hypothetical protein
MHQDVSQLVDVCRQSIVFKQIDDLVTCLQSLIEDKEAIILRVKNRLDRGYDASCSAGYRDVGLNLRIDSEETIQLGVQMHVCEVQLILTPFAEIKVCCQSMFTVPIRVTFLKFPVKPLHEKKMAHIAKNHLSQT